MTCLYDIHSTRGVVDAVPLPPTPERAGDIAIPRGECPSFRADRTIDDIAAGRPAQWVPIDHAGAARIVREWGRR